MEKYTMVERTNTSVDPDTPTRNIPSRILIRIVTKMFTFWILLYWASLGGSAQSRARRRSFSRNELAGETPAPHHKCGETRAPHHKCGRDARPTLTRDEIPMICHLLHSEGALATQERLGTGN